MMTKDFQVPYHFCLKWTTFYIEVLDPENVEAPLRLVHISKDRGTIYGEYIIMPVFQRGWAMVDLMIILLSRAEKRVACWSLYRSSPLGSEINVFSPLSPLFSALLMLLGKWVGGQQRWSALIPRRWVIHRVLRFRFKCTISGSSSKLCCREMIWKKTVEV